MIKKVEGEMNGTKEMSKKHFIDSSTLSEYLEKNIPEFSGPLKIEEFIGCLLYTSPSPRDAS